MLSTERLAWNLRHCIYESKEDVKACLLKCNGTLLALDNLTPDALSDYNDLPETI